MSNQQSSTWKTTSAQNVQRNMIWTLAWLVTLALASFGPAAIWDYSLSPSIFAVVLNLAAGFGMLWANKQYVQGLDEMQRKIFLDAAALSLGVVVVCGLSYELLEDIKLISFQPEIPHVIILMSLTFIVGITLGNRAHQ